MAELRWSKLAFSDLEDIISYISKDSEENARSFVERIIDSAETLLTFPYSGRMVPELKSEMIREKIIDNYRVIYRINGEIIEIIRVLNNARKYFNYE